MSLGNIDETFDFVLDNVCNRIKEISIRSAPCMIGNHLWRISTKQVSSNSADSAAVKYLGVYLECGGTAKPKSFWCNFARRVQLIIVSQKEGVDDLAKKFKQLYSSKVVGIMGFDDFIAWNDLINPENGFIRCDRIILRAHVCIDNVETVSWGCIGSCGKLKNNMTTAAELNTTENDMKNSATFDFVVENFSNFENTIRSPACMIYNLSWKIALVKRSEEDDNPSSKINLGFFAECNRESVRSCWCCIANIQLTIVSQKEDVANFAYECRTLFYSTEKDWGYRRFKGWSYVVDPQNGFIKDDIVIFRAYVRVDISPRSVSWASAESREVHNATGIKLKTPNESAKFETSFDLVLEKVSELKDSVISIPCKIHSLPWKIKVTRYKNPADSSSENTLGIFLVCDEISQSWSCFVHAQLMIVSLLDADYNEAKEIQHTFSSTDNSRGFEKFISLKDVINPKFGYIKHDCIVIRAEIIADVPRGMEWNSKKKTGYVGLKNQGTCFMNSILQTLYFIGQFRKAIYQLPNENDDVKSLTSALQKIFHQLQTKDEAVNVTNWVRCLRSETLDLFAPIDVVDFVTMLFEKLEDKMKSTCVEGTIRNLFEGKIEYFVKCTNIDHEYRWTESFYCIELDIRISVDLSAAFDQYVYDEILDKGLQYDAGDLGLQDARKSIIFESFPPVLLINLNRFDYHHITGYCDKFDEYLDFYEKMDLNKYLKNPQSTPADYTLFAVLAHDGDSHGGRYVVFINPKCDETWYEFDDEVVSICLKKAAIENNVGRELEEVGINIRTACVLVYIRDSMIQQVLQEVTKEDIPSELRSTDGDEPEIKRAKREEYISIRVLLEDCFDGHQGPDLFDFTRIPDLVNKEETLIRVFEVEKTKTVEQILTMLSKSFGRPLNQMRIWPFTKRANRTYRPMYFDVDYNKIKIMDDIVVDNYWNIFLEMFPLDLGNYPLPAFDVEFRVLLFFKLYEPKTRKIYYCEHAYVERDCTIAKLILKLNEKAGYPPDTKLILYEECKSRTLQKIAISPEPLNQIIEEFLDGDIIVFQKDDLAENLPSVETYYAYQ